MSFSSDVKQELNKSSNLSNKELVKYELLGYLMSGNANIIDEKILKFKTESDYNINRFSKLLTNLDIDHKIEVKGKSFVIQVKVKDLIELVDEKYEMIFLKSEMRQQILDKKVPEERIRDLIKL